jgi:hypothetical protein
VVTETSTAVAPVALPRQIAWWREFGLLTLGYLLYAQVRTLHGTSLTPADNRLAERNGRAIWDLERALHLDWEHAVQRVFLPHEWFVKLVGGFYGGAHFFVTLAAVIWLLAARPQAYRFWRSVLAVTTFTAVGIFAVYPAWPPRVFPVGERTVDTLDVVGGLWSYNHGVLERISDPFAPMPSLHLAWATWVAAAVWSALPARRWRTRLLVAAYPAATYFAVIVTGTHFVIDGVAGMALLGLCYLLVRAVSRRRSRNRGERTETEGHERSERPGEPQRRAVAAGAVTGPVRRDAAGGDGAAVHRQVHLRQD